MERQMKCPICGTENTRLYWTECVGVVEDYYSCDRCGYFHEMAYSPYHEGIELMNNPKKLFQQIITLLRHFHKAFKYRLGESHF